MKKYITIAALLTVGTAFANAEAALKTTFANAAQETATSVTLSANWIDTTTFDDVSVSWGSLVNGSGDTLSLQTKNAAGGDETFLSPNTNVGSGNSWKLSLTYDFGSQSVLVDSVDFHVATFDYQGVWQGSSTNRYFDFTVALGNATGSIVNQNCYGNSGTGHDLTVQFDSAVELSGNVTFSLEVEKNTNETNGCFIGLESVSFSVIPEPSAFGLLAGLGALALMASRRRRR